MDIRKRTNTPRSKIGRSKIGFWKSLIMGAREDSRALLLEVAWSWKAPWHARKVRILLYKNKVR
jgi:hypothetical protein